MTDLERMIEGTHPSQVRARTALQQAKENQLRTALREVDLDERFLTHYAHVCAELALRSADL